MHPDLLFLIYYLGLFTVIFFLSKFIFNKYLRFSLQYGLFKTKNTISTYKYHTPDSGGIIYAVVIMISTITLENLDFVDFKNISPEIGTSILIVFFGYYQDFLKISNFQKYIILSFLISMLVYSSVIDVSNNGVIDNLHGFLGIYKLDSISSFIFTFLVYVSIINAISRFNDVIGYVIIFSVLFFLSMLYIYHINDSYTLNTISIIIIAVSIFIIYNNYNNKKVLLVGNSGTLFMGFWIAYFFIQYITTAPGSNLVRIFSIKLENIPIIALSLISMPFYDTLRIVLIRIIRMRSPFSDDLKWHLHHIILKSSMTNLKTSLFMSFINFSNCVLIFLIEPNFNSEDLMLIFILMSLFWYIFFEYLNRKNINSSKY